MLQRWIEGEGVGVFVLMWNGKIIARFSHRRIREKPPSGGVSVLCESIEPPPGTMNAAIQLLNELQWSGVAMVEFKWDRLKNLPQLMEVNARFWGSIQLAISAGVDFPYMLYSLALGKKVEPVTKYKIGIRSRWELGDLDHLWIRFRDASSDLLPSNTPSRLEVLKNFLFDFFRPSVRNEVLRLEDPAPFLHEFSEYVKSSLRIG